ncbi:phage portal protein [Pandoraea commovens]|uniref:Phage portal protein n=1 Tax=Pandoraea commovens TaxID=2508289 RepID=A0ABY5QI36_9BURK|nr:phage portal protein [Pandoraea commovens]UVA80461.1 phage portal protein [Pandoraea commovens]
MSEIDQTGRGNWLDRTIEYFAPGVALRREHSRVVLDMHRSYEAAKVGRRTAGWHAGSGSANVEIGPSLVRVRNRCREMVRNNEYAAKTIDALVTNTVGTGFTASAPEQQVWDDWCAYCDADGQLDFNGLTELAQRTRRESGEVLIRFRQRLPEDGYAVPLQIQVLEPDHLDHSRNGPINGGNFVIAGVEFNLIGQRVAYWLFPHHPGDVASFRINSLESKRVPASEILHYYRKRRPSQVRGMPELGVSLLRLRDLADYEQAELVRKKIEACFVAFVSTDNDQQALGTMRSTDGVDAGKQRQERVAPGMIKYLSNAESVDFGSPAASGGYGDYTTTQLFAVAAGAGVTYEQLTGDGSRVNYSAGRSLLVEFRQAIAAEQWLAFVPMVLNPIAQRFQVTAKLAGAQRAAVNKFTWTAPRLPWVDPLKDAMAIKELARGGFQSISEAIRERGDDPDKVFAEIKAEREKLRALGIVVDSDAAVSERLLSPEDVAKLLDK